MSWNHGRHNFKFGGQWWRQIIKTFYAGNNGQLGLMDFDGRFTASSTNASHTGDGGADFCPWTPLPVRSWCQHRQNLGAIQQRHRHLCPRHLARHRSLTLNLGLRYDAHTPWVETNNQQANYNFATGNIDLAGKSGASRALYNGFYGGRDFQPRIGFAWTPAMLGDQTVIRGAFTISSYLEGTGTNLRLPLNPPFTPAEIERSTTILHFR